MKSIGTCLCILFILFFFSCAPPKRSLEQYPKPQPLIVPKKTLINIQDVAKIEEIDKRIAFLKALEGTSISEKRKRQLMDIINTYEVVKGYISKKEIDPDEAKKLIELLYKSFSSLEIGYTEALKKTLEISKLIEERKAIFEAYKEGRYTDVVNQCLELKLRYGADILSPDMEVIFAISLGKIGMLKEAIDEGENVMKRLANIPSRDILQKSLEEWKNTLKQAEISVKPKEEKKETPVSLDLIISHAKRLIEQENYEQALSILNEVKESSEQIDELKNRAIEGIINRERNKAAKLFLLAKEEKDIQKKKEYLEDSYRILEALIVQYPESPLIKRVEENLKEVEKELNKINAMGEEK